MTGEKYTARRLQEIRWQHHENNTVINQLDLSPYVNLCHTYHNKLRYTNTDTANSSWHFQKAFFSLIYQITFKCLLPPLTISFLGVIRASFVADVIPVFFATWAISFCSFSSWDYKGTRQTRKIDWSYKDIDNSRSIKSNSKSMTESMITISGII